ncbi:hypothetical protein [Streptomyces chromofuscus]|uniref:Uncharacterized protein n=1 Tax=Streptomyces chromofuscus TaxID=42881 RepID=A0A7M2T106_STRCW|nr:hypothetical protein [Streptomyces chromofuscus]QOV42337.1 hypothetical protein IPT68_21105 [Streptomyces chromofuscus]
MLSEPLLRSHVMNATPAGPARLRLTSQVPRGQVIESRCDPAPDEPRPW